MDEGESEVWEASGIKERVAVGLAIIERDNREKPYRTPDLYYAIFRAVQQAAITEGNAGVIETLGTMPPQVVCGGDYQDINRGVRKLVRGKLVKALDAITTTIPTDRYSPGQCPKCGAKLYVLTTGPIVRRVGCKKCGFKGKRPV